MRLAAVQRPERAFRSAFRGIAPRRANFDFDLAERERETRRAQALTRKRRRETQRLELAARRAARA